MELKPGNAFIVVCFRDVIHNNKCSEVVITYEDLISLAENKNEKLKYDRERFITTDFLIEDREAKTHHFNCLGTLIKHEDGTYSLPNKICQ